MQGEFFFFQFFPKKKIVVTVWKFASIVFSWHNPYAYHGKNLESGANLQFIVGSSLGYLELGLIFRTRTRVWFVLFCFFFSEEELDQDWINNQPKFCSRFLPWSSVGIPVWVILATGKVSRCHTYWLKGEAKIIIIIIIMIIISPPKFHTWCEVCLTYPLWGQEAQIVKKLILIVSEGRRRRTNLLWLLTQVYRQDTNKETV